MNAADKIAEDLRGVDALTLVKRIAESEQRDRVLRTALHQARDFIAVVDVENGLTIDNLIEMIDSALKHGNDAALSTPAPDDSGRCHNCKHDKSCFYQEQHSNPEDVAGCEHWASTPAPEQPSEPLTVQPSPNGVLVEDRLRNLSVLQVEQPLQITCPFDWQQWRFHTQEQAAMFQKHLDWHAKEGE